MTEEEKDILILKILERPQSLSDVEVSVILSDEELLDIYNTSLKVMDAVGPVLEVNPTKEWELMKARIQSQSQTQTRDNANGTDFTSDKPSVKSLSDEERKTFIASFLRSVSKKPIAAAVGTFVIAASIAIGFIWNPDPIRPKEDSNGDGIAQNIPDKKETVALTQVGESDRRDNPTTTEAANSITSEESQNQTVRYTNSTSNSSSNSYPVKEAESYLTTPNKDNSNLSSYASVTVSTSETKTDKKLQTTLASEGETSDDEMTIGIELANPTNPDLAYTEDYLNDFSFEQLDGLLPDDWDIDECVRLQQARLDNQIAMVVAQTQRQEFEAYRQNLLIEYEITNPDADKEAVQKFEEDIEKTFGRFYSVLP